MKTFTAFIKGLFETKEKTVTPEDSTTSNVDENEQDAEWWYWW